MSAAPSGLGAAFASLPMRFAGPGGAAAVVRDGVVLEAGAWGFADPERRVPFTRATPFPVCSITKQFTCTTVLRHAPDPEALAPALDGLLPSLDRTPPVATLCHNQSGLRDSWALAMLCGAPAERRFDDEDTRAMFACCRSLQFAPGTHYSYSNGNFRLLADALQRHTGQPFGRLLREGILDQAGMVDAVLAPDTSTPPGGIVGHEGSQENGFRPAVNRICWQGDAGLFASVDDLVAWERFIDRTRDDSASPYARLAAPVRFVDGAEARYGFGLARLTLDGRAATGHGGALRGFRSFRCHLARERLSVVVLFNHMADPRAAAFALARAALGIAAPTETAVLDAGRWRGMFVDESCGLAARLWPGTNGEVRLDWSVAPDLLRPTDAPDAIGNDDVRIASGPDGFRMKRSGDHLATRLLPVADGAVDSGAFVGRWRSDELEAELTVVDAGGVPMAAPSGFLGNGRMETLEPFGRDRFLMPCRRALDQAPPGNWTLGLDGNVLHVGCWLARGLVYRRV